MATPPDTSHDPGDARLDAGLRQLHGDVLHEEIPASLRVAAQRLTQLQAQRDRSTRWLGLAASVLLAFGGGWLAHGQLQSRQPALLAGAQQEFVRQASYAYSVYLPEKRHPVEVAASEQEHLVQWLSKRLGRPLKIPVLQAQGFHLVGGRLLPGAGGARAQFMFESAAGQRVTLYLGALGAGPSESDPPQAQDAQFRFVDEGATRSFYWVEQGFAYALSGSVEREQLMALAKTSYLQLQP